VKYLCIIAYKRLKPLPVSLFILALAAAAHGAGMLPVADATGGETALPTRETPFSRPVPSGMLRGRNPETSKFYCGDRIVAPGDSRSVVLEKCGEPAWKEVREDIVTGTVLANGTPVNLVTTEEWVYNFGSTDLIRFLRFQGDRLAVIETGGYGYDDPTFGQNCADGKNISLGDSRFDVLVKCGAPMESRQFEFDDAGQGGRSLSDGNEWIYNFGPDRFIYTFKFRKGRVTDIRTGGYGH